MGTVVSGAGALPSAHTHPPPRTTACSVYPTCNRVMDGQARSVVTSTWRTLGSLYRLHKSANLRGILDAFGHFYAATDIYGIGTHLNDGLCNVLSRPAARQNNRLTQTFRHQRPIKRLTCATRNAWHIGIEQHTTGILVERHLGGNVIARFDPQCLDIGSLVAITVFRALIAMELQQIKRYCIENLAQLAAAGIDKQAHRSHKRRQGSNNRARLLQRDGARALGIKHQANRIRTRLDSRQCILYAGNATNLAANG